MKKLFFLIITILLLVNCYTVKASSEVKLALGICASNDCLSIYNEPGNSYILPSDKNIPIGGMFYPSSEAVKDVYKAVISFNLGDSINIVNSFNKADKYDVVKEENTFTLTLKDKKDIDNKGVVGLNIKLPVNNTGVNKEYVVNINAKLYDEDNKLISESSTKNKLYVLGKMTYSSYENNYNVKSIKVTGGNLSPAFNKNVTSYTINTLSNNIKIEVEKESSKATLNYYGYKFNDKVIDTVKTSKNANSKTFDIYYGTTTIMYGIVSERNRAYLDDEQYFKQFSIDKKCLFNACPEFNEKTSFDFEIKVIKSDDVKDEKVLKSLSIDEAKIDFKPDVKTYDITVDNEVSKINIKAAVGSISSFFEKDYGPRSVNLDEGNNKILIKFKNGNGDIITYTLNVLREKPSDATLKEIYVGKSRIITKKGVYEYTSIIDNDVRTIDLKFVTSNKDAKVEYKEDFKLNEGDNLIEVTVIAPNEEDKQVYKLNIKKDGRLSTNSRLQSLKIDGYDIDFYGDNYSYNIKINREDHLSIDAKAESKRASVIITGNKDLKDDSIIKIEVKAQDGTSTTYEIAIQKDEIGFPLYIVIPTIIIGSVILIVILINTKDKRIERKIKPKEYKETDNKTIINDVVEVIKPNNR